MAVRRIGIEERRARIGVRHHLAAKAESAVDGARALVALHGTDPASVHLAATARMRRPQVADVEQALYEERRLLRMLGMRRTMFTVPVEVAPVVQAACTDEVARRERRRTVRLLAAAGLGDEAWLAEVEEATVAALRARGEAFAAELSEDEPRLKERITLSEGKAYEARPAIANRVLIVPAAQGRIVRGRPRGSWTSSQFRWSPMETWLPGGLPELPADEARAELVRRWLGAYGPGTAADLKWWLGLTLTPVREALAEVGAEEGPGRADRVRAARRRRPGPHAGALGRAAARARPDGHGLDGPRLVPRRARPAAVRPQRQRRADGVVRRPRRRRLGAAA